MIPKIARIIRTTKLHIYIDHIRTGWNRYSFIFFISGVAAILGGLLGFVGVLSILITVGFFYYAGKLDKELERQAQEEKG